MTLVSEELRNCDSTVCISHCYACLDIAISSWFLINSNTITIVTIKKLLFYFEHIISCFRYSYILFLNSHYPGRRSQRPRGLRRRSAAARLLRLWVRIPPGTWMSVCCACYVLPGRGLCDELITRPEEYYRLWCVVVCDLETL
jgi:hypothetical protein